MINERTESAEVRQKPYTQLKVYETTQALGATDKAKNKKEVRLLTEEQTLLIPNGLNSPRLCCDYFIEAGRSEGKISVIPRGLPRG